MPATIRSDDRRRFLRQLVQAGVAAEVLLSSDPALSQGDEPLVLEAYFNQMSCVAGDSIGLCVSTNADRVSAEVLRVGKDSRTVWRQDHIRAELHEVPERAAMYGCNWPVSVRIKIPHHWRSGIYVARLQGHSAKRTSEPREAIFIVRPADPGTQSKILLQVATNTYQAYNEWAGTNLYSGPDHARVSFNRPFLIYDTPLQPGANWYNPNTSNYHAWDEPFIRWAEDAGYWLDCCANLDLESHPELLKHYQLVLSVGHDEYWSSGMRDSLEAYIAQGGNVAFFSGNSICWQVRVEKQERELVCYKRHHDRDPVYKTGKHEYLTTLWSDPLVGRPENYLSGVGFAYGGYNGLHGEFMARDGILESSATEVAYIGSSGNVDEFFHGAIRDVRIYRCCLGPKQLMQLARSRRDVALGELTGWWELNGNFQNSATTSAAKAAHPVGDKISFLAADSRQAVRLNGTNQTLKIPNYPGLQPTTNRITIAAWIRAVSRPDHWFEVYRQEDPKSRQLLAIGNQRGREGIWCGLVIDQRYFEAVGEVPATQLYDGNWHHVAATFDGVAMRLYCDGREAGHRTIVEEGAGEYTVHRPDHWILRGTGLRAGDKFGAEDSIAGYECDGCEFVLEHGIPVPTGRDGTPLNFEIAATAPARWDLEEGTLDWAHSFRESWAKEGLVPDDLRCDGNAALGTYQRGGTVVTTGSCDWSDGMKSGNKIVETITRNIFERLTQ